GTKGDDALKVPSLVLVVGDRTTIAVEIILTRAPARSIPLGHDPVHAIRREKAVVDSLAKAVLVDGIAEVSVRVTVVVPEWCGGHAKLVCGLEVVKNLAPVRFVPGAPPMTLINDDEIEEVGIELTVEPWSALISGDRLVDSEVHLAALHDLSALDLVPGI